MQYLTKSLVLEPYSKCCKDKVAPARCMSLSTRIKELYFYLILHRGEYYFWYLKKKEKTLGPTTVFGQKAIVCTSYSLFFTIFLIAGPTLFFLYKIFCYVFSVIIKKIIFFYFIFLSFIYSTLKKLNKIFSKKKKNAYTHHLRGQKKKEKRKKKKKTFQLYFTYRSIVCLFVFFLFLKFFLFPINF